MTRASRWCEAVPTALLQSQLIEWRADDSPLPQLYPWAVSLEEGPVQRPLRHSALLCLPGLTVCMSSHMAECLALLCLVWPSRGSLEPLILREKTHALASLDCSQFPGKKREFL